MAKRSMTVTEAVRALPWWGWMVVVCAMIAAAASAAWFVPTRDVAYEVVPPISLDDRIAIDGVREPLQGKLSLVGVEERHINLVQKWWLRLTNDTVDFDVLPPGQDDAKPTQQDVADMVGAKDVAAGVAFELAGQSPTWTGQNATVDAISVPSAPAARVLRPGDLITSVDGRAVSTANAVRDAVSARAPGSRVVLGVVRAGDERRVSVATLDEASTGSGGGARLGVDLSTIGLGVRLPRRVTIDSGTVVGPSAGLAFAIGIYDLVSGNDLLRGRHVVATGSLSSDGSVSPVGRVRQKAIAAQQAHDDLLLVPSANEAEARAAVRSVCDTSTSSCVVVVPVDTAAGAVNVLRASNQALEAAVANGSVRALAATPGA